MPQAVCLDYDRAAGEYATHRAIHTGVFRELCAGCGLRPQGRERLGPGTAVLEVGCGTGNYVRALVRHLGCAAHGLDPSAGMLAHARTGPEPVGWALGRAEHLAFADDAFDLVFSVDVIHHVAGEAAFFCETARTLRPAGRVCTVTDSEAIIRRREVLSGYFPETVEIEVARYPRIAQLMAWMVAAGLVDPAVVTVEEPYELTSAQPFRDRAYSSLHLIPEAAWQAGLERLERDLAQGPIRGALRYACVWGQKPAG
jgi:ubiquinone/menaquinone biosynthesis C-methylase UbiE